MYPLRQDFSWSIALSFWQRRPRMPGLLLETAHMYVQCNLDLVTTCDLVTILQRPFFNLGTYIKSFDLVTLCDSVTVFAETKSVTKSRLHCTCKIKCTANSAYYLGHSWARTILNTHSKFLILKPLKFHEIFILIFQSHADWILRKNLVI